MLPGQTLKRGKYEVMLFPGTQWNCVQYWGERTFSHCCGFPIDHIGGDLYAPCTVVNMGCIDGTSNCELWVSQEPVIVPYDDKPHMIAFQTGHCNTMRGQGTVVLQGQYLTSMGRKMNGSETGCEPHSHIEFCILPDGATSTDWQPPFPPCAYGSQASTGTNYGTGVASSFKGGKTIGTKTEISVGQAVKQVMCYSLIGSTEYYKVCYMNDTANDTSSQYASFHKYAKGLTWVVPREQRALLANDDELFNNMRCVYGFFKCLEQIEELNPIWQNKTTKWTDGAIAGMIANMKNESGMNPNRWQNGDVGNTARGYGLVQWTPATEILAPLQNMSPVYNSGYASLWDEAMNSDPTVLGNAECQQIFLEYCNGLQWGTAAMGYSNASNMTFEEWATNKKFNSLQGAAEAAMIFQTNYERPLTLDPERAQDARVVYQLIQDQKWDEEMPAGKAKMEIINPWDMATEVDNMYFRTEKDFVPVYICPYYASGKKSDPITFKFDHYMFTGQRQYYERYYFGAGGYDCEKPMEAVVCTWLCWSPPNPSINKFHYFAPSTITNGTYPATLLAAYKRTDNPVEIDKERFSDIFSTEVTEPYSKKIYFKGPNLKVTYDLIPVGDYDEKSILMMGETTKNKTKISNKAQIVFVPLSAREQADEILSKNFVSAAGSGIHLCIDSKDIIQTLSLNRQFSEFGAYMDETIGIYFTANKANPDTSLLEDAIAELVIQNYVSENLEESIIILNSTSVNYDSNNFLNNIKTKIAERKKKLYESMQANLLAKIKSQQQYNLLIKQMEDDVDKLATIEKKGENSDGL